MRSVEFDRVGEVGLGAVEFAFGPQRSAASVEGVGAVGIEVDGAVEIAPSKSDRSSNASARFS